MEKFDILVGLQTKLKLFFFPEKDTIACIFLGKIDDAISLLPANSDQSSSVNDQFMLISETADLSLWIQLNPAQWLVESPSFDCAGETCRS